MSKYDLGSVKLSASHRLILEQIKENSTVLECGCATGYMTQFMKERLNCKVYIIEYDRDSFNIAMNFAEDGICCDLMQDEWLIKFRGMKFDYILFADVLEHLYNPVMVLRKSVALLKNEGLLITSLPNIANNDVISNLYNDNWQYTSIGLLDNTHIRFWGKKNLQKLFEEAGLSITKLKYNTHAMNRTEQKIAYDDDGEALTELLSRRPLGTVYQFIITAQKMAYCIENKLKTEEEAIDNAPYEYTFFYSSSEFNKDEKIIGHFGQRKNIEIEVEGEAIRSKRLRFDPIEGFFCAVKNLEVSYDSVMKKMVSCNGIVCGDYIFFKTKDPQIMLPETGADVNNVRISAEVIPMLSKSQFLMMDIVKRSNDEKNDCTEQLRSVQIALEESERQREVLVDSLEKKELELSSKINKISEMEEKYGNMLKKISEMENSRSWKITSPLRKFMNFFR